MLTQLSQGDVSLMDIGGAFFPKTEDVNGDNGLQVLDGMPRSRRNRWSVLPVCALSPRPFGVSLSSVSV